MCEGFGEVVAVLHDSLLLRSVPPPRGTRSRRSRSLSRRQRTRSSRRARPTPSWRSYIYIYIYIYMYKCVCIFVCIYIYIYKVTACVIHYTWDVILIIPYRSILSQGKYEPPRVGLQNTNNTRLAYVHVHMCIYANVCIHTYIHILMCVYVHMYICVHVCMCVYIDIYRERDITQRCMSIHVYTCCAYICRYGLRRRRRQ